MSAHALSDELWFHDGPWSEQEYLDLPPGGPRIELIDGSLVVSPAPRRRHQQLMQRLAVLLDSRSPDGMDVAVELNVRVGPGKILIPDVVATSEPGDVLVHDPDQILMIAEVISPANADQDWITKNHLYARAGLVWYLLIDVDPEDKDDVTLVLRRLDGEHYVDVARARCGESLRLPGPFGDLDPADLLKRRL